jgi:hypothetical protein
MAARFRVLVVELSACLRAFFVAKDSLGEFFDSGARVMGGKMHVTAHDTALPSANCAKLLFGRTVAGEQTRGRVAQSVEH